MVTVQVQAAPPWPQPVLHVPRLWSARRQTAPSPARLEPHLDALCPSHPRLGSRFWLAVLSLLTTILASAHYSLGMSLQSCGAGVPCLKPSLHP